MIVPIEEYKLSNVEFVLHSMGLEPKILSCDLDLIKTCSSKEDRMEQEKIELRIKNGNYGEFNDNGEM